MNTHAHEYGKLMQGGWLTHARTHARTKKNGQFIFTGLNYETKIFF